MNEIVDPFAEALTEGEEPKPSETGSATSSPSVSASAHPSERAGGVRSSSKAGPAGPPDGNELEPEGSVGQTADVVGPEAPDDAIGTTGQEVGLTARSQQQKARRGMARQRERAGVCPMYAPRGTVCKTCGKVHPL